MKRTKKYEILEVQQDLVAESRSTYGLRTYVSLFSSAGVGCYGFKVAGYHCLATVELIERRLNIQRYNQKCIYESGYICGDLTQEETQQKVFEQIKLWACYGVKEPDVLIATPPCQGMSVANHKKKDELKRNSLVVESIKMTLKIKPKVLVFENVRAFLTSICTDIDGTDKPIREAIEINLGGCYNILYKVVNFKDYGSPSSRTRTLVIGVRKDIINVTPYDLFPNRQAERTLRQTIGHLPSLHTMGEIWGEDIYHSFRPYAPHMEAWIADIKEGQSAFDNTDPAKIPHRMSKGVVIYNAHKNGDKYTRQCWDKVAPCIHTRNDIMASQNTVHPTDNRVFSIREVMLMMSVPDSFQWSATSYHELNAMSEKDKRAFLKKEEMNIRQSLGEAVPTTIFYQIAMNARRILEKIFLTEKEAEDIVVKRQLINHNKLKDYIAKQNVNNIVNASKVAELANAERDNTAAYYTRQDVCFSIVNSLPESKGYTEINILEPSVGVGNFLPTLISRYADVACVNIDVVDINEQTIDTLQQLVKLMNVPSNVHIRYICDDFLLHNFDTHYDIVVGNPPYMKITQSKDLLSRYKAGVVNKDTNNIFSFFIEKALQLGDAVALIVPKSLINAPEFGKTRLLLEHSSISKIIDFGEKAFRGVKIETVAFVALTKKKPSVTFVESYITEKISVRPQSYVMDHTFPYWLLYRDDEFDQVAQQMEFNIFKSYRDRVITKSVTKPSGKVRVLKSRNIGNNQIIDIDGYDCYVDDATCFDVAKYMNNNRCVLVPNLTYNPRACFLPKGCIADGSVAILTPIDDKLEITDKDLAFYATQSFSNFYSVARNKGSRSMNIDNNSVFFFGKLK